MKAEIMGAHPRVCGENRSVASRASAERGSSPRVRGKQLHGLLGGSSSGLIPACAGKTSRAAATWTSRPAHPRVCGENAPCPDLPVIGAGSSPRVRGKRDVSFLFPAVKGLIPACAGKTLWSSSHSLSYRAHPRVCGENWVWCWSLFWVWGSSPRVRGKRLASCCMSVNTGLIPACAGKTTLTQVNAGNKRAHPRVCGENRSRRVGKEYSRGSSPRVRGKPARLRS